MRMHCEIKCINISIDCQTKYRYLYVFKIFSMNIYDITWVAFTQIHGENGMKIIWH